MNIKQKTNEEIAKIVADQAFQAVQELYQPKMIYVPESLKEQLLTKTKEVLQKEIIPKYPKKSLSELVSQSNNLKTVLKALRDKGVEKVWTIKELSEEASLAPSVIHKTKHRMLAINLLKPSALTKHKTRFTLTEKGLKEIEKILDIL